MQDRMYGVPAGHSRTWSTHSNKYNKYNKYNMANVRMFQYCFVFAIVPFAFCCFSFQFWLC